MGAPERRFVFGFFGSGSPQAVGNISGLQLTGILRYYVRNAASSPAGGSGIFPETDPNRPTDLNRSWAFIIYTTTHHCNQAFGALGVVS